MGCLSPQLAIDFVTGALPPKPSHSVEEHMAQCHDCRRLIVEIAKEDQGSAALPLQDTIAASPALPSSLHSSSSSSPRGGGAIELVRGAQVGRYTLLYPLGEGGMGSVHAAFDPKLDRRVALKFLRTDLESNTHGHRERLLREARALARLSHPNVVSIFDVAEASGSVFLAMELIDGNNARLWRELGDRTTGEVLKVYSESLSALISAHEQGIIHRDFKPDNVMVGTDGIARVTDFGLACAALVDVDELLAQAEAEAKGIDWDPLTQTGLAVGTPRYMAPEQFFGQANELTDQFSFCLSMYEALYGHYPLGTKTPRDLTSDAPIEQQLLAPLAKGSVPDSLRKTLLRGMALRPADRWPNAKELSNELSRIMNRRPTAGKWLAAVGLVAAVVGAAFLIAPSPPPRSHFPLSF